MKFIVLSILILVFSESLIAATSIELNIPLTESGYNWFLSGVGKHKIKTRRDVYLDSYAMSAFVLRPAGYKLRIKQKDSGVSVGASWKVAVNEVICGANTFNLNVTESYKTDLDNAVADELLSSAWGYFDNIEQPDSDLFLNILEFDYLLRNVDFVGRDQIFQAIDANPVLPSQWNEKERVVFKIKIYGEKYEVILGKTYDRDADGYQRTRYELEFEFDDFENDEILSVFEMVCKKLDLERLTSEHIQGPLTNGDVYYLNILQNRLEP